MRKQAKEEKSKTDLINEHIDSIIGQLKLLTFDELIITLFLANKEENLFSELDLLRTFTFALDRGITDTAAPISIWIDKYKDMINKDERLDDSNIKEGLKDYDSTISKAINTAKG